METIEPLALLCSKIWCHKMGNLAYLFYPRISLIVASVMALFAHPLAHIQMNASWVEGAEVWWAELMDNLKTEYTEPGSEAAGVFTALKAIGVADSLAWGVGAAIMLLCFFASVRPRGCPWGMWLLSTVFTKAVLPIAAVWLIFTNFNEETAGLLVDTSRETVHYLMMGARPLLQWWYDDPEVVAEISNGLRQPSMIPAVLSVLLLTLWTIVSWLLWVVAKPRPRLD